MGSFRDDVAKDDEKPVKKKPGGSFRDDIAADDVSISENPVTPKPPQQDWLQGGLTATQQLAGNTVYGAAKGIEDTGNMLKDAADTVMPAPDGQAAPPIDLSSAVKDFAPYQVPEGEQQHPIASSIAQGVGSMLPTLPAWELGSGAAGMAGQAARIAPRLRLMKQQAASPQVQALLGGLSKMSGADKILSVMTKQGAGGFLAGIQEELAKETSKPGSQPNVVKILQAGVETGMTTGAMGGATKILTEGAAKAFTKLGFGAAARADKEATAAHNARLQDIQAQKDLDARIQKASEAKALAEEEHAQDRIRVAQEEADHYRAGYEAWMKELHAEAKELRKLNGTPVDRRLHNHVLQAEALEKRIEAAQLKAEYFQAEQLKAAAELTKELEAYGMHRKPLSVKSWSGIEPSSPTAYKGGIKSQGEHAAEMHARERDANRANATEPTIPPPKHVDQQAEGRALSFVTGKPAPAPYKGGFIEPPKSPKAPSAVPPEAAPPQTIPAHSPKSLEGKVEKNVPNEHADNTDVQRGLSDTRARVSYVDANGQRKFRSVGTKTPTGEVADNEGFLPEELHGDNRNPFDFETDKEAADALAKEHFGEVEEDGEWKEPDWAKVEQDIAKWQREQEKKGRPVLLGMNGAEAVAWLQDAWRNAPSSEKGMNFISHLVSLTQKTTDIFGQYANDLAGAYLKAGKSITELHGGLEELFKNTRAKVAFAQMSGKRMDPTLLGRALKDKLTPEELKNLTPEAKQTIKESQAAIKDYLDKVEPILAWLNENTEKGRIASNSSLGRLRVTLDLQVQGLKPSPATPQGNLDNVIDDVTTAVTKSMLVGKASVTVIHAAEKGVVLMAREGPITLGKAIKRAYHPGSVTAKFADEFLGEGILTEAFEETGVTVKSTPGKLLTGKPIEQSPNRVAAMIGLDKAAKEIGYASADSLASDILAARKGRGPLAYDNTKLMRAIRITQDYVSDITGINTPGFRDANVLQRNQKLRLTNLFLTARITQSRNMLNLVRDLGKARTPAQYAKASAAMGTYLFAQYLVAGDKGALPVEVETGLRDTAGAPRYYKFMDGVHAARAAVGMPSVPHIQPSISPVVAGGGASAVQIARELGQAATTGKVENKVFNVAKAIGIAAGGELFGMGTGVALDYGKAVQEGQRGYKTLKVYQHEALGGEKRVADIPVSTDVVTNLAEKYWGAHSNHEAELEYHAQKSMDLERWVRDNASKEYVNEALSDAKDLDEVQEAHALNQEKNEALKDVYDSGFKEDSDEARKIKEHYTKLSAQGDKQLQYFKARAAFWQRRAEEVMKEQAPAGNLVLPQDVSSSKANL